MTRPVVGVLDHGMGNLRSVTKALEAAGATVELSPEPSMLSGCDALCVPGQGIFGRCVAALRSGGTDELVAEWIADGRPFLGICLGMQVLFTSSEERGPVDGLALFAGNVVRLPSAVPVPHIGWNEVNGEHYYFDHSYAVVPDDEGLVAGWCDHGTRFAAIVQRDALLGVQFHPEKSGQAGLALLQRWLAA